MHASLTDASATLTMERLMRIGRGSSYDKRQEFEKEAAGNRVFRTVYTVSE
jgi:hypothetical protein